MRPYRRKHHSSWRTRRGSGLIKEIREYLKPFVYCTKTLWRLEPPFPMTAKVLITAATWFLLFLPLCYFLVPPFAVFFVFNHFSGRISLDSCVTYLGESCAKAPWLNKIALPFRLLDRLSIVFFLYDYYQIFQCLRAE